MVYYYKLISHKNTTDKVEEVVKVTSTETEKKKIHSILISKEVNGGDLMGYVEREEILQHSTGKATIHNFLEMPINRDLPPGQEFKLTLQNEVAGTNAEIYGLVKYEIT